MNILREARKRLHERSYYGGHYGEKTSEEYIADQLNRWNTQPPTRTKFCKQCGSEVRWIRETPSFSVATGKPVHSYHLKCPHLNDSEYERERLSDSEKASDHRIELYLHRASMHYDSHEYRSREDDRGSFDQEDLW